MDAWQSEQFGALPLAGGLWDQPMGYVMRMTACKNAYTAFSSFIDAKNVVEWSAANPNLWKIVTSIKRLQSVANDRRD